MEKKRGFRPGQKREVEERRRLGERARERNEKRKSKRNMKETLGILSGPSGGEKDVSRRERLRRLEITERREHSRRERAHHHTESSKRLSKC